MRLEFDDQKSQISVWQWETVSSPGPKFELSTMTIFFNFIFLMTNTAK